MIKNKRGGLCGDSSLCQVPVRCAARQVQTEHEGELGEGTWHKEFAEETLRSGERSLSPIQIKRRGQQLQDCCKL